MDDLGYLGPRVHLPLAGARCVLLDAAKAVLGETRPPIADRAPGETQLLRDLTILDSVASEQNNARPKHEADRCARAADKSLQSLALLRGQVD